MCCGKWTEIRGNKCNLVHSKNCLENHVVVSGYSYDILFIYITRPLVVCFITDTHKLLKALRNKTNILFNI